MWVPQKISHIYSRIDFFHKVLHDFQVKNSVSSNKRIELSGIPIMLWGSVNSIEQFILIWILSWNHLGVAKEMFQMCSVDNFMKWTHKIIIEKSWLIKLRKIDKEDMENEMACDSSD